MSERRPVRSGFPRSRSLFLTTLVAAAVTLGPVPAGAQDSGEIATAGLFTVDIGGIARLQAAQAAYRRIADQGAWQEIGGGAALREGDFDARIAVLRRRLQRTGDLTGDHGAGGTADALRFDSVLADAVRWFQTRHGLEADGIVGRETRAALNVPAAERAAILGLNIDRMKALKDRIPPRAAIVNIAAAELVARTGGLTIFRTRTIVGLPSWPTPTLDGTITQFEINPFWNVPPRIARIELIPKIAADPGYLAAHDMRVLSKDGTEVAPDQVDWSRFAASGLRLRQEPGPRNPLGTVKFVFQNDYDVFLHDTPAKALFAKSKRMLSHGCVRIQDPFTLATLLLQGDAAWTPDSLRAAIATGTRRAVPLKTPMPLFLVYVTAWVDPTGTVQFRNDAYGRDTGRRAAVERAPCGPPAAAG